MKWCGIFICLLGALLLASLLVGTWAIPAMDVMASLLAPNTPAHDVVWHIRAPRAVLAALVGAALGVSGAILQTLFRNPLADPGILGVSAVAGFAATLGIALGLTGLLGISGFALLGAAVGAALIVVASQLAVNGVTLIVFGAGLASLAGAGTALVFNFSPSHMTTADMMNWLMGSVANRDWRHVGIMMVGLITGGACLWRAIPHTQLMSLGEDTAISLGVRLRALYALVFLGVSILTGFAVATSGVVGFVGLAASHMVRPLVRQGPAFFAAASLMGAMICVMADLAIRLLPSDQELKMGVLTAVVGAPVLMWVSLRMRRGMS